MRLPSSPWPWLLAAALLLGIGLRVFQLGSQLPAQDELYSLWLTLNLRYPDRMSMVFPSASGPAALIGRAVAETVGLDEWSFRLEPLAAGLGLLLLGPWIVWRRFGPATAAWFAALVAISPLLVWYSRFVRAYSAPALLVFLGVFALQRWLERERLRDALGYSLCAIGACWFHPLASAAALSPPFAAAGLALLRRRGWGAVGAPVALGVGTGLLAIAVMAGPGPGGLEQLLTRAGPRILADGTTLVGAMRHLAGTGWTWLGALASAGVLVGAALALRRRLELAALMAAACVLQLVAVARSGAFLSEKHWVFARYTIFVLPFLLLFLAVAISELSRTRLGGRAWPLPGAAALVLGLLWISGPHPAAYYAPNPFMNHQDFQISYSGGPPGQRGGSPTTPHRRFTHLPPPPIPEFYQRLAAEPGDFAIVEAPGDHRWERLPFHYYQRVHGKRVRVGIPAGFLGPREYPIPLDDPRLRFDSCVDLRDPEALRGRDLRYAVFHKGKTRAWVDLDALRALYREHFGAPVFEDETIEVYAID